MNWIAFLFALELGIMPNGTLETFTPGPATSQDLDGDFYVLFEAEATLFDFLFIGGDVRTEVKNRTTDKSFSPHSAYYGFRAGIRLEPIEVGFRHMCAHPVVPGSIYVAKQWEGWYDEVYIRAEVKN